MGANLVGTPGLWFGLMSSPAAGVANGPLGLTCSNFVGYKSNASLWRYTSPTIYNAGVGWDVGIKVGNAFDIQSGNGFGGNFNISTGVSAAPSSARSIFVIDFTRSGSTFTLNAVGPSGRNTSNQFNDFDLATLTTAMTRSSLSDVSAVAQTVDVNYSWYGADTVTGVDEGTNGTLNAIYIGWDFASVSVHVSDILFSYFSS